MLIGDYGDISNNKNILKHKLKQRHSERYIIFGGWDGESHH